MVRHMRKYLFSSKAVRAMILVGAVAALPVAAASASTDSTTIFATAQGTSILGQEIPVLGTQGWSVTLPINSAIVPQFVWDGIDFTVTSEVKVGDVEIANLYLDPRMTD
jgi:hypothetical protein